jgi:hypothetical protein
MCFHPLLGPGNSAIPTSRDCTSSITGTPGNSPWIIPLVAELPSMTTVPFFTSVPDQINTPEDGISLAGAADEVAEAEFAAGCGTGVLSIGAALFETDAGDSCAGPAAGCCASCDVLSGRGGALLTAGSTGVAACGEVDSAVSVFLSDPVALESFVVPAATPVVSVPLLLSSGVIPFSPAGGFELDVSVVWGGFACAGAA